MSVMKRKESTQRIIFCVFLMALVALQFENLVKVSRQVRHATSLEAPSLHNATTTTATVTSRQECIRQLGKNGTWIQDWNFAKKYGQYKTPLVVSQGPHVRRTWGKFVPSSEAPFRWESSWKWHDFYSNDCQIDYTISPQKLCETMQSLQVTRILFFGDSLTQSMGKSLLNKMDSDHVIRKQKPSDTTELYHLTCDESNNVIQILMAKEGGGHGSRSNPTRLEFFMSNTTRHFVTSNPYTTLSILNIGAHYHAVHEYKEDFDSLLDTMDSFQRPHDFVFFRTTVPGHKGCVPRNPRTFNWTRGLRGTPLRHFDEYKLTSQYSWNLFFSYNEYTKQKLAQRNGVKPTTTTLLDVTNMTILRQDGHMGGADCLHYYTPGPVDWWNHLLYTFLTEMASNDKEIHTTT